MIRDPVATPLVARRLDATLVLVEAGLPEVGRQLARWRARVGEMLWGRYVRRTADALVALDPVARDQAAREGFPEMWRGQAIGLRPILETEPD